MDGFTAWRRYYAELGGALLLYAAVLTGSLTLVGQLADGPLRTLVGLSPMLPFLLATWAILRQFRRMDEYQRLKLMEDVVVAAAVTAGATFTYGFLETLGWPTLSMFAVWPFMAAVWALRSAGRGLLELRAMRRE